MNDTENKERPFIGPGWYKGLSNEEYHGSFGYSSSGLKTLVDQTPAHLHYGLTQPNEPTANMQLGTALHTLVLEPEKFDDEFAVSEKFDGRTKAGKAAKELFNVQNAGKVVLSEDQVDKAKAMAAAVLAHPIARLMVTDCITESSIFWWYKTMEADDNTEFKTMLKVRPDAISRAYPVVVDLKSSADGSFTGFAKSIINFGYHISAAMYLEGVNQCEELLKELGRMAFNKFVFVVVENFEPHLVSVYELSINDLDLGKAMYRSTLRKLKDGQENDWPGYPEEIRVIELPAWANRAHVV